MEKSFLLGECEVVGFSAQSGSVEGRRRLVVRSGVKECRSKGLRVPVTVTG